MPSGDPGPPAVSATDHRRSIVTGPVPSVTTVTVVVAVPEPVCRNSVTVTSLTAGAAGAGSVGGSAGVPGSEAGPAGVPGAGSPPGSVPGSEPASDPGSVPGSVAVPVAEADASAGPVEAGPDGDAVEASAAGDAEGAVGPEVTSGSARVVARASAARCCGPPEPGGAA